MQGFRTGYPPVVTVSPQKRARAHQLEVNRLSKCHFQYISLLGQCAHQNPFYLFTLPDEHLQRSVLSYRWRFASGCPSLCSALPSPTLATSSSTSAPPTIRLSRPAILNLLSDHILNIRHLNYFCCLLQIYIFSIYMYLFQCDTHFSLDYYLIQSDTIL